MPTTLPRKRTALVIGCGIGGPAAALALGRAGLDCKIFEAHDGAADRAGSFLNLASNGLDALTTLGVRHQVLAQGFPTARMVMWSYTGKRLGEVANGLPLPDGTTSITVRRGLLHRTLHEETVRRGTPIAYGKRLTSVDVSDDGVVAHFDDGTSATGDLMVGADGLHSRVRSLIDPDSPRPRYTGQLSIGGIACAGPVRPSAAYHMIFGRRAFFGYATSPTGEVYWFANVAARAEAASAPRETWKERLLALFTGDAGPACDLIRSTGDELGAYPIYDMPAVPTWHRGPMVLLGDAIHATSPSAGQGAAMAVEDAVTLAQCLRDTEDASQAFRTYETLRRARVERVVAHSRRVGSTKVAGPVGRVLRDMMMPLALKLYSGSSAHAWLYQHHIEWDAGRERAASNARHVKGVVQHGAIL
jgi:FAD-dependent urate hydroxylase